MNEKGEIRIKEEKSRLPVDVRGSKMSVLKLPEILLLSARRTPSVALESNLSRLIHFSRIVINKLFDSLFSHSYKCLIHFKFEIKTYFVL